MKELEGIIRSLRRKVYNAKFTHDEELFEGLQAQTLSAILAWIESKLPKERTRGDIDLNAGFNIYRQQALKNFGIKAQEEKYGLF